MSEQVTKPTHFSNEDIRTILNELLRRIERELLAQTAPDGPTTHATDEKVRVQFHALRQKIDHANTQQLESLAHKLATTMVLLANAEPTSLDSVPWLEQTEPRILH